MKKIFYRLLTVDGLLLPVLCLLLTVHCSLSTVHAQLNWTQTNGPYGGDIQSLCINPANGYLFAGTYGGGVFLSTNNGTSWTAVNTGLTYAYVSALAISGSNIFAGTNDGVFLSTNNGTSWTAVNTGLTNTDVEALAISGSNIFAGTDGGGVFLSTNNGASWTAVNNGLTATTVLALAISGSNLFAGTSGGVFLSTNNGTNWTEVNNGLTATTVLALAISGSNLFAGTSGGGVFLSTNNGASWTAVNTGLTATYIRTLAISGSNIFAGTYGDGVFLSNNNGTSWTAVNTGLTEPYVRALAISGSNIFAGTYYGGVFLSTNNGASWTAVNTGLTATTVLALAISGSNIFAGTDGGGVFLSTNNGTSWTAVNNGLTNTYVEALAISGSNIFAGTLGGGVFLSTNNGASWTAVNTGLTNTVVRALAISGSNIFAGTDGGVFLSTNNGTSWTAVNTGLTNTVVRALAISGSNIFAGTYYGGVFLSTNNGTSWTAVNTGLTEPYVLALAISGSNIFAGTYGDGVFLSTNNGASWTAVNNGLTATYIRTLAISGSNIFAGTWGGVFLSTNNGASWTAVNNGLTEPDVLALAISGSNIFAGTYGSSVFKASMVAPTAPTGLTATATSSSRINLSWTASGNNPERYRIYRSTPYNSSYEYHDSTTSTSYSDTRNTTPNTIYYYKVYGVNAWGVSEASNEDSAKTMMIAPSFGTPSLSVTNPTPGQAVTVTVTVNGTSPAVSLTYGNSIQSAGTTLTMNYSSGSYSRQIPSGAVTTDGLWYRITAQNAVSTVYYPSASGKTNIPVTLNSASFGSVLTASGIPEQFPKEKYFTVALPCSAASVNLSAVWGAQKRNSKNIPTNWRAGTYNSATQQFADVTVLSPNTAYVIYNSAGVHPFSSMTSGLTNAPGLLDNITLVQGWNLIPWPYAAIVNVAVTNATEIDPIWYLDDTGWHGNATQFKPFRTYAIRKKTTGTIFLMNVISLSPALAKTVSMETDRNWSLKFSASCGDHYDLDNYIGTGVNALNEYDPADAMEPFDMQDGISLYFTQSDQKLAFDIRSSDEPGHIWDAVMVNHSSQSSATLTWDNSGIQNGWLVDMDNNRFINLSEQNSYTFRSLKEHRFKLIAGDQNYVAKEADALKKNMPETFHLYANYPNPFNPNTTIRFDVAKTGNVKLQIYNVLGQLVTTLVNGTLETGKYDIQWNGKDARGNSVSSGIYIYRIVTDGYVKARKMVLVR